MTDRDEETRLRRNRFYLAHPAPSPDDLAPVDYLIHTPSRLAPTSAFVRFRDGTLHPLMAALPDDPNLPRYAARVEEVLAWRESVPPEGRFWRDEA